MIAVIVQLMVTTFFLLMPQVMSDTSKLNQLAGMEKREHSVFSCQEMNSPFLI